MTKPKFLHELPIEQLKQMSQQDIKQTIKAEQLYFRRIGLKRSITLR